MNYFEYWGLLDDKFWGILGISVVMLIAYLFIYRKYVFSLFDPFSYAIIASAFANATPVYLFVYDKIKPVYFYQFVFTELAFLLGFFLIKPISKKELGEEKESVNWYDEKLFLGSLFYCASVVHILLQFFTYTQVGLPILMDSRVLTYSGGSGFGLIGRITEVSGGIGTILLLYRVFYLKFSGISKWYNIVYLVLVLFFLIVSGNKTNIVFLVYYLFLVQLVMRKIMPKDADKVSRKINKIQISLFILSFPLILFVMYVQFVQRVGTTEGIDPGNGLLFRVLSYGDVYYMSLPHDVILRMNNESAGLQLFKDFFGTFRLIPWQELPIDAGLEIQEYHSMFDAMGTGPNARYNYFAMLYFSPWVQIIYCFVVGVIGSFIRNSLYRLMPSSLIYMIPYVLISFNIIYLYQDQAYTFGHTMNIVIIYPILLLISTFIYWVTKNWNKLINS